MSLSVLIPVKDPEPWLPKVLKRMNWIRDQNPGLIGEILLEREGSLLEARIRLVEKAGSLFVLNLDADSLVPEDYPRRALTLLERHPDVGAVGLDYHGSAQGHPAFGTSVMRRDLMRRTYSRADFDLKERCECMAMWELLERLDYVVATLPLRAYHKKLIAHPRKREM